MAVELPVLIEGVWQGQARPSGEFEAKEVNEATGEIEKKQVPYGPTFAVTYFDADGNFKMIELKSKALDDVADIDVAAIAPGTQVRIKGQALFYESKTNRGQGFFRFDVLAIEQL